MKKSFLKGLCLCGGIMMAMSPEAMATDANGYYTNDVTAPWGSLTVVGANKMDNVNYVDSVNIEVKISASDDMCAASDIKYYISTSEISNTAKITAWEDYVTDKIVSITLPSIDDINVIYLVLKDKNGNTSMIYDSSLSQNVVYDLNADDAGMSKGMANKRVYGAPFVVTSQTPIREGYYFLGWGVNSTDTVASYRQGDIIPADVQIGTDTTATLYAIWEEEAGGLPQLADVVSVGDYVNYPVAYDNVNTYLSSYKGTLTGWRVLSKDVDIDENPAPGTVNLVSAGVPLTYNHSLKSETTIMNLAINFLDTAFSTSTAYTFRGNGFNSLQTLKEVFTNDYTATYLNDTPVTYTQEYALTGSATFTGTKAKGTLKVRAMTKQDLDKVFDPTGATESVQGDDLTDSKYNGMLAIPANKKYCRYWLATASDGTSVRGVGYEGDLTFNTSGYTVGVRPVVSLKPEVLANGTDATGAWNITLGE